MESQKMLVESISVSQMAAKHPMLKNTCTGEGKGALLNTSFLHEASTKGWDICLSILGC